MKIKITRYLFYFIYCTSVFGSEDNIESLLNQKPLKVVYGGISNFGNLQLKVSIDGVKHEESIIIIKGNESFFRSGTEVILTYTLEKGVVLRTLDSKHEIVVSGGLEHSHPIDWALKICLDVSQGSGFSDLSQCNNMADSAWDNELNRAYDALGGLKNEKLKLSQRAWIKYRDLTTSYLQELYLDGNQGWSGQLNYETYSKELTKTQSLYLWALYEW